MRDVPTKGSGDLLGNPLASDFPRDWDRLLEALGPASLLVLIHERMGAGLRRTMQPEDVLQEALLHAWRDRVKCEWRGLAQYRSWFLTVIDHRIHDLALGAATLKRGGERGVLREADLARDDGAGREVDFLSCLTSTTPGRVAAFREQAQAMRAALGSLPEDLREVVRLRLFEELTSAEVAERLGLGLSAVKHRFLKGAEIYQRCLRRELATASDARPANP